MKIMRVLLLIVKSSWLYAAHTHAELLPLTLFLRFRTVATSTEQGLYFKLFNGGLTQSVLTYDRGRRNNVFVVRDKAMRKSRVRG